LRGDVLHRSQRALCRVDRNTRCCRARVDTYRNPARRICLDSAVEFVPLAGRKRVIRASHFLQQPAAAS
jgi:hypothetical protein